MHRFLRMATDTHGSRCDLALGKVVVRAHIATCGHKKRESVGVGAEISRVPKSQAPVQRNKRDSRNHATIGTYQQCVARVLLASEGVYSQQAGIVRSNDFPWNTSCKTCLDVLPGIQNVTKGEFSKCQSILLRDRAVLA